MGGIGREVDDDRRRALDDVFGMKSGLASSDVELGGIGIVDDALPVGVEGCETAVVRGCRGKKNLRGLK